MKGKGGLAIVIGGPPKKGSDDDEGLDTDEPMDVGAEAKSSAVRDLFRAIKTNDVAAGEEALGAYMRACGYGDDAEDAEDEEV